MRDRFEIVTIGAEGSSIAARQRAEARDLCSITSTDGRGNLFRGRQFDRVTAEAICAALNQAYRDGKEGR